MGVFDVRNHRHAALPDLVLGANAAQTSLRTVAPILRTRRNRLPVALRHDADHVVECARNTFAVQPQRL